MNHTLFLVMVISIFISSFPVYAEIWTLNRTVDTALNTSNLVAVEKLEADEAYLDALTAEKGWFPSFRFSAGANYVSEVMKIDLPFKSVRFGDYDSYDMNVSFHQLLYDGGRLKALKEAGRDRSSMFLHEADAAGLEVEFQAKAAFFNVIMAEDACKVSQTSLVEAQNHFHDVGALHEQGMALENDVLKARLRISNAEMEKVAKNADLERARAVFRRMTGLAPDDEVIVTWNENDFENVETKNFGKAFALRPEFKAFDAAIEASEQKARAARADIMPNIGLFGRYNYGKPGLDMPANEWMDYFSSGVLLSCTLWDWGNINREVEKARINKRKIVRNRDNLKLIVSQQITEAFSGYEEVKKRKELAAEAGILAKKQLELTQSAYREGMATETDYDNAHTAFTKSAYESSISKIALWLSMAKIEYVLGIRYTGGDHE